MAGELLNMGYALVVGIVAILGVVATLMITDGPDNSGSASSITAIAVALFTVAIVASLAL
jgi:protein-S-isoprenylcysteine O-methyltransferase Ste14